MAKKFSKLTRLGIRKLTRGSIGEHGIVFHRLSDGDGCYEVNVMVDGQRIHRAIGKESEGVTRKQAEDCIEQLRTDARHGRLNLPKGRKTVLRVKDAAQLYLDRLEKEGGKDLKLKKARLERHLIPFFGPMPLSRITSSDIERYKSKRQQEPSLRGGDRVSKKIKEEGLKPRDSATKTTPATINRELAVLSHLFNKAVEWGLIAQRPAKLNRFREEGGRAGYLTGPEIASLVKCAKVDSDPDILPFVFIGVETSMRAMEVLSMRRENVLLEKKLIFIPSAKAGPRNAPITSRLAHFLARHMQTLPADCPWIFPSRASSPSRRSAAGHRKDIRKPYERVVIAAGLNPKEIVRHTLRHTTITHLVQSGVDLLTVKRISGHKTLAMVERYFHANGAHIQAAMDKLENRVKLDMPTQVIPDTTSQEIHKDKEPTTIETVSP